MPDAQNSREGPQVREPSNFLNGRSYGERLAREAFWLPATRGSKKASDRAITLVAEAVHVPAHLLPPRSLKTKHLHHFHAQLSLGQSCHRQKKKKKSCTQFMRTEPLQSCPTLGDPVDCGLPGFSVREGVPQVKILKRIGQDWLPYPSRALYFLLPQPHTLLTRCCPNTCDPNCYTTFTPSSHRGKPKPSRAASGGKPPWTSHMQRWK